MTAHDDREMRCPACSTRVFSSRAPDLVAQHFRCPRCLTEVELVGPPRAEALAAGRAGTGLAVR